MKHQRSRSVGEGASPAPPDTRRSLPIALLRAREAVMTRFRPMLARHDITEQQWRILRVLAESDAVDATEVAARAVILAPSLTRTIRLLEERGLMERGQDAADRRRILLRITAEGRRVIASVSPESREIYRQLEDRYGRRRIEALLDMLDELASVNGP
jgi:homoprotocatechuate degradation regulator HpaR